MFPASPHTDPKNPVTENDALPAPEPQFPGLRPPRLRRGGRSGNPQCGGGAHHYTRGGRSAAAVLTICSASVTAVAEYFAAASIVSMEGSGCLDFP